MGDFMAVLNILTGGSVGLGTDLFTLMTKDRTQGNAMKLNEGRFRFSIRKSSISGTPSISEVPYNTDDGNNKRATSIQESAPNISL